MALYIDALVKGILGLQVSPVRGLPLPPHSQDDLHRPLRVRCEPAAAGPGAARGHGRRVRLGVQYIYTAILVADSLLFQSFADSDQYPVHLVHRGHQEHLLPQLLDQPVPILPLFTRGDIAGKPH